MTAIIFLFTLSLLGLCVYFFLQQAKFGKLPSGERLFRIEQSPNYKDGKFQNQSFTPDLAEDASYYGVIKEFIFNKNKRNKPSSIVPSKKTDLLNLDPNQNTLVWFGHASYFLQLDGKKILVDPVLSGAASPIIATTLSYPGTDVYSPAELPEIDYLFISHDHWDHLDYETMLALQPKIKKIVTGLGTGQHLEHWGFDASNIIEKDWHETEILDSGFSITATPARHFSGRSLTRNKALWVSFVLKTPTMTIYIGGDSGYDKHFAEIGTKYGPFDLAILECGQYDKSWKYIHMMPEEVVKASQDLNAKVFMPVHWAKFSLGNHAWDDPILRVNNEAKRLNINILHPMIGEEVNLKDSLTNFPEWWKGIN
ncbi:MAG: MBL fold metallo-hydrolase [Opitutaceae bacterium]|nr:MBL fold metallo-hydrolase [Cytophagales bacterium]